MNKSYFIKTLGVLLFIFAISFTSGKVVKAAPQNFLPVTLTQPDGDKLECFASGDEFFNYYHDAEGNLIIKNKETEYYTYAKFENDEFVPTDNIVTSEDMERVNSGYIEGRNHEIKLPYEQIGKAKDKHLNKNLRNEIVELIMEKSSDSMLNGLKQLIEDFLEDKNSIPEKNEVCLSDIDRKYVKSYKNSSNYEKGKGAFINSEITYNLNGKYSRFISDIGLDDEADKDTLTIFTIFADDKLLYNSSVINGNSDTKTVDIDITGVNELKLVVDKVGDNIRYNHDDWADAKLIHVEDTNKKNANN